MIKPTCCVSLLNTSQILFNHFSGKFYWTILINEYVSVVSRNRVQQKFSQWIGLSITLYSPILTGVNNQVRKALCWPNVVKINKCFILHIAKLFSSILESFKFVCIYSTALFRTWVLTKSNLGWNFIFERRELFTEESVKRCQEYTFLGLFCMSQITATVSWWWGFSVGNCGRSFPLKIYCFSAYSMVLFSPSVEAFQYGS